MPLVIIGLAFIRKVLEESIGFNKTSSPVLADSIPTLISSSPRGGGGGGGEGTRAALFPKA